MGKERFAAQGTITVRRLRNGDTFYINFKSNGIPLYQGIDPETGVVAPDWTVAANQPVITPEVASTRGATVYLSDHRWFYNSSYPLSFTGAAVDGWVLDSTGRFALDPDTGALKIVANLASKINTANDTLKYTCTATVSGIEYELSKTVDIIIQNIGASSYFVWIDTTANILNADHLKATLTANIMLAGEQLDIADFTCKWYNDPKLQTVWKTGGSIEIGRNDVDGTGVFLVEIYKEASDLEPLFRTAITITDALDEYQVVPVITSAATSVSEGNPVTVKGQVIRMRDNTVKNLAATTVSEVVWESNVMGKRSDNYWYHIRTVDSDTVTVSTADTDDGTILNDIEVVQKVEWYETI